MLKRADCEQRNATRPKSPGSRVVPQGSRRRPAQASTPTTPATDGVIERFFESIEYDELYRHNIDDGDTRTSRFERHRHTHSHIQPDEAIGWRRPANAHREHPVILKPLGPRSAQDS